MGKVKNHYKCSLGLTFDLVGGKWKLIILWHLIEGPMRFTEIKKAIPDLTQKVLTEQLRELERTNIVNRKVFATVPTTVEYSMTLYGQELVPLIKQLCDWTKGYALNHQILIE